MMPPWRGNFTSAGAGSHWRSSWPAPHVAQSGAAARGEPVAQIGGRGGARPPAQIGAPSREIGSQPTAPRSAEAPAPQLSSQDDSTARGTQLTGERGSARVGTQLSRPSQSRQATASRIGGRDRCDEEAARRTAECRRVIETRAAEFRPPEETPLSPEQRLLVDQRLRAGPGTAQTASRRLGVAGLEPDSIEEQGVAAIALSNTRQPARDEDPAESEETLSAEAQALINAIVQGATGVPPSDPN